MCGEQSIPWPMLHRDFPSPPRVRGTVQKIQKVKVRQRITPACAGNSDGYVPRPKSARDHPRVCGEQRILFEGEEDGGGSPPRVRGTDSARNAVEATARITPACAGNSQPPSLCENPI